MYGYVGGSPISTLDLLGLCTPNQFDSPVTINGSGGSTTYTADDLNTAVRAVYGEAINNPDDQYAVATVLWNRIGASGLRGGVQNTFTGVIYAPNAFQATTGAKFNQTNFNDAACNEYNSAFQQVKTLLGDSSGPGATGNFNYMNAKNQGPGWVQVAPGGNYFHFNPGVRGPHN